MSVFEKNTERLLCAEAEKKTSGNSQLCMLFGQIKYAAENFDYDTVSEKTNELANLMDMPEKTEV